MGRLPASLPRITTSRRTGFRGCRYFVMFRPPSLLTPLVVPTAAITAAGQLGLLRPGLLCFVTSAHTGYANRPSTGNRRYRDFHPARLPALSAAHTLLRRFLPPGRGGLLQLLGMSLSPCCRFHPAEVTMPHR